jgi:hypothetical protein
MTIIVKENNEEMRGSTPGLGFAVVEYQLSVGAKTII